MITTDLRNSFHPYPKPLQKKKNTAENTAEIKKRSSKQAKLERERDKGLIKKGKCDYCGRYFDKLDPHEVYGGSNRKRSIKNKFVALLCRNCHDDNKVLKELKVKYQKEYEKTHTREEFIKLIGKSYIKGNN
jgi:hypothetical protein